MKVRSVSRKSHNGLVYNFHCLPSENYFTNGMLVHNCYKSNTSQTATYMTLATYQRVLNAFPKYNGVPYLTQVALGITGVQSNPDFIPILEYTRALGIVPNFTMTGVDLTDAIADRVAELCGAVAISAYPNDKQLCYNTVQRMTERGMTQVNIHLLYHADNMDFVYEVLRDVQSDARLANLNAVVLLAAKPKGRGARLHNLGQADFTALIKYIFEQRIPVGFDSCSAPRFLRALDELQPPNAAYLKQLVEPCESFGLFSTYVNVNGEVYPCSFAEHTDDWQSGISMLTPDFDFQRDVWNSTKLTDYRALSIAKQRSCILFDLDTEDVA